METNRDLNVLKQDILDFFRKGFPEKTINEDTILFELIKSSIDFVVTLSKLEEVLDIEIALENIEDITKITVDDILSNLSFE